MCDIDKINRPSHLRRAIGLFSRTYFLTSYASPNDTGIVIVIIIVIIGEAKLVFHVGGIIA
jgi:hypothetical protein